MAENKTRPTDKSVPAFLAAVEPPGKRAEALALDAMFRRITGFAPVLWGPTMIGYGRYDYIYASGHSGTAMATGFSPRKTAFSIYILPGYANLGATMARLGKHQIAKSCLYVKRLSDIDLNVLEELVRAGLHDLAQRWPIEPNA